MAEQDPQLGGGTARSPGVTWAELMAQDSRPAPACLTNDSYAYLGSEPLAAERYTSEEFARAEREKMWPHVWQFAAREEDLPRLASAYLSHSPVCRHEIVQHLQKKGKGGSAKDELVKSAVKIIPFF